jgi:hypothetical protein
LDGAGLLNEEGGKHGTESFSCFHAFLIKAAAGTISQSCSRSADQDSRLKDQDDDGNENEWLEC